MKRILGIIAIAIAVAATFTGCNNKPAFAKLAAAVDSANIEAHKVQSEWIDSASITYDEVTNTVKYSMYFPGKIDKDQMAENLASSQDMMLTEMAKNDEFNVIKEAVDAKANLLFNYEGAESTKFEALVENSTLAKIYNEVHPQETK